MGGVEEGGQGVSTRANWLGKLGTARHWAAVWRQRYVWNPTRHNRWKLEQWRNRQAYAQRVVDRHSPVSSVSTEGLDLIRRFEGFRSEPYRDTVGVWTIGYGETAGIGPNTKPWSQSYAEQRLRARVNRDYLKPVLTLAKAVGLELRQNEADALANLAYNVGPGVFEKGRTMGDAIRSRNRDRIADAFLLYDHAGGRVLEGLTRRRRRERELFLKGR
jgi:lysozyme